jgi:hypothetical protein
MTSYSTALGDLALYRDFFHALVAFSKSRLMSRKPAGLLSRVCRTPRPGGAPIALKLLPASLFSSAKRSRLAAPRHRLALSLNIRGKNEKSCE